MALQSGLNPEAPEFTPKTQQPHIVEPLLVSASLRCIFPHQYLSLSNTYLSLPPHRNYTNSTSLYHHNNHSFVHHHPPPPPTPQVVVNDHTTHLSQSNPTGFGRKRSSFRRKPCYRRNGGAQNQPKKQIAREKQCEVTLSETDHRHSSKGSVSMVKKKFSWANVLPLERDSHVTTVMIKNIPNKYTRELLIKFLDDHCFKENHNEEEEKGERPSSTSFDFLYLPMDFRTNCNKGYAFVNFTDPKAAWRLYLSSHNKSWEHFQSPKIREIVSGAIQGKEALVKHFEASTFACQSDEYLPVCFSPPRDGSGQLVKQSLVGKRVEKTGKPSFRWQ
ncbi:Mei2-like, C-terminal RNA recognition motif [Dillenia turbinata]|uniref:Mei2-like, C-terminal RNA recognition motif n=1 Tax=Dillenia turbinata TaxID=194707 RepID=A0AAN8WDF8_9MAGN